MCPCGIIKLLFSTGWHICDAREGDDCVRKFIGGQESGQEVAITKVIAAENSAHHGAVGDTEPGGSVQLQLVLCNEGCQVCI